MVNEIDFLVDVERLGYVDIEINEIFITYMGDVFERSRFEVVNADDTVAARK